MTKFRTLIITLLLLSCTPKDNTKKDITVTYTDDLGRTVKVKEGATRFLPLAASLTEMLYFVCDTSCIVGRTPTCNYPEAVKNKPVVNNYPPDLESILLLKPDLILTKDGMQSDRHLEAIRQLGIPVYIQKYERVEDIFTNIGITGRITGNEASAKHKADSLRKILADISGLNDTSAKPSVLVLISREAFFAFGKNTYATDILKYAGAINAVDSIYNNPYPMLSAEYILKINPDIILGGKQVGLEEDFFSIHPELKRTNAYRNKRFYTVDEDYLSRPGPRVVEAVKAIKTLVNGQ